MGKDLFGGIEQSEVPTSAGPCAMPILYTDAHYLGLIYRVDVARATACLPANSPFEVMPIAGKAAVQLAFFEYRASTVGAYNEVALAITVRRKGKRPSTLRALIDPRGNDDQGWVFSNLPVTTEGARAAGCEIWNYPKYVTGIDCDFRPTGIRGVLEGELELLIGPGGRMVTPGVPFLLMSVKDGRVLRTTVETNHKLRWGGAATTELRVIGDGPTSDNVARMGLDALQPSFAMRTMEMRSVLPLGKDVGPA